MGYFSSPQYPSQFNQEIPSVSCSVPPMEAPGAELKVSVALSYRNLESMVIGTRHDRKGKGKEEILRYEINRKTNEPVQASQKNRYVPSIIQRDIPKVPGICSIIQQSKRQIIILFSSGGIIRMCTDGHIGRGSTVRGFQGRIIVGGAAIVLGKVNVCWGSIYETDLCVTRSGVC